MFLLSAKARNSDFAAQVNGDAVMAKGKKGGGWASGRFSPSTFLSVSRIKTGHENGENIRKSFVTRPSAWERTPAMTSILPLSLALSLCFTSSSAGMAPPPRVVILYADDLGYADLGCFGGPADATPNLDRLAREGRRFTHFYVAQAVCSASRAGLLTGCYPNRIGILGALGPQSKNGIADEETTLAELLRAKGYQTAIFGKWHLGHHPQFLPTRHGFGEFHGLPYSNDMWPKHPTSKFPPLPLLDQERIIAENPDQTRLTADATDRAVRFIEKNRDQPFFLYVPYSMPHVPLHVSKLQQGKSGRGLFGDVIREIDWSVGRILDCLAKHRLEENTLVVFTSDNGPWLSYGNHAGSAKPLREGKGTTFEGGVRVPCVMRWPGRIPAGSECRQPAMTIDLVPTVARITGASLPRLPIDGRDILSLMEGTQEANPSKHPYFFWWGRELQAVRWTKWKLHFPHAYQSMEGQPPGVDGKPGKYLVKRIDLSLFDLEADPGETRNVADQHPDVVKEIQRMADEARVKLGDSAQKKKGSAIREPGMVVEVKAK